MTEEQIDCAALAVYPLQKAFESRSDMSSITLPLSGSLARLLIVGGGGCGKTTLLMKIMMPVLQTYLHGMLRTAPSNKAARSIGGRTCHNASALKPSDSLRTAALHFANERKKMEAIWTAVGSLAVDEFSQLPASLFHAMAVRSMYARAGVHRLHLESYCQQSHLFGSMPVVIVMGDPLQLPPIPKSTSLLQGDSGITIWPSKKHWLSAIWAMWVKSRRQVQQCLRGLTTSTCWKKASASWLAHALQCQEIAVLHFRP